MILKYGQICLKLKCAQNVSHTALTVSQAQGWTTIIVNTSTKESIKTISVCLIYLLLQRSKKNNQHLFLLFAKQSEFLPIVPQTIGISPIVF